MQMKTKAGEAKSSSKSPRAKSIHQTPRAAKVNQEEQAFLSNTPSFTPAAEKLIKSANADLYRQSRFSESYSHLQDRLRNVLQTKIEQAFATLGGAHKDEMEKNLQNLQKITDTEEYATEFMRCHAFYIQTSSSSNPQLRINLSKIERTRLTFFQEEDDGRKRKNANVAEKEKEQLKRQLFRCRELAQQQEKRLVSLAEEFKRRKTIYLKEIERLSKIVSAAIGSIPQLLMTGRKDTFNPEDFQIGSARSARNTYNNIRSTKDEDDDVLRTLSKEMEYTDRNNDSRPLTVQRYRSLEDLYFPPEMK